MNQTITGINIPRYRLVTIRQMLKLESLGMKSSGGALRPRLAKEFALSPRATYNAYIAAIDDKLKETNVRT